MATKQPHDKSHFILPDLGEGVHEAELIRWCVAPGEQVAEHQTMAEMETDKALVEVPSPWTGVIKDLNGKPGDVLKVGSILVTYDIGAASKKAPPAAVAVGDRESNGESNGEADAGTVVGSVDSTLTVSAAFTRRRETAETTGRAGRALATPAVRRIARAHGIDINLVTGSGRGGRVTAGDVESFVGGGIIATATAPASARVPAPVQIAGDGIAERIPFRGLRRTIAEALDRSVKTAVHFTVVDEADITELDKKRREYGHAAGRKISMLPFVMVAACKALRRHPGVNANVDDEKGEILVRSVVNLGCAVDTDHGLMVPVIPSADTLSLIQLADRVAELAAGCRDRSIPRERLMDGTFTISNVGSYGGMFATPIINYPEVAILAVGRGREQVLTRDGMIYVGRVLPLSLSCDHRVVDGAAGARFLGTMVSLLEQPDQLIS